MKSPIHRAFGIFWFSCFLFITIPPGRLVSSRVSVLAILFIDVFESSDSDVISEPKFGPISVKYLQNSSAILFYFIKQITVFFLSHVRWMFQFPFVKSIQCEGGF